MQLSIIHFFFGNYILFNSLSIHFAHKKKKDNLHKFDAKVVAKLVAALLVTYSKIKHTHNITTFELTIPQSVKWKQQQQQKIKNNCEENR